MARVKPNQGRASRVLNALMLFAVFKLLPTHVYYVSMIAVTLTLVVMPVSKHIQHKLMPELKFSFRNFHFSAVKELLVSGSWNTINQCGRLLMTGLDLLLAKLFISPEMMGVLSVAKIVPSAIIVLGQTPNSNFAPELVMDHSRGDKPSS